MVTYASNIFYILEQDREKAEKLKFEKFAKEEGDFFFFKEIYNEFITFHEIKGDLKRKGEIRNWVQSHYLNIKTLYQVMELEK